MAGIENELLVTGVPKMLSRDEVYAEFQSEQNATWSNTVRFSSSVYPESETEKSARMIAIFLNRRFLPVELGAILPGGFELRVMHDATSNNVLCIQFADEEPFRYLLNGRHFPFVGGRISVALSEEAQIARQLANMRGCYRVLATSRSKIFRNRIRACEMLKWDQIDLNRFTAIRFDFESTSIEYKGLKALIRYF